MSVNVKGACNLSLVLQKTVETADTIHRRQCSKRFSFHVYSDWFQWVYRTAKSTEWSRRRNPGVALMLWNCLVVQMWHIHY